MRKVGRLLVVLCCGVCMACASTPMRRSFKETYRDEVSKTSVRLKLARDKQVRARNVSVRVYRGVATLTGRVETEQASSVAEQLAGEVHDVVMVENHLVVKDADDPRFMIPAEEVKSGVATRSRGPIVPIEADVVQAQRQPTVQQPTLGARGRSVPASARYLDKGVLPPSDLVVRDRPIIELDPEPPMPLQRTVPRQAPVATRPAVPKPAAAIPAVAAPAPLRQSPSSIMDETEPLPAALADTQTVPAPANAAQVAVPEQKITTRQIPLARPEWLSGGGASAAGSIQVKDIVDESSSQARDVNSTLAKEAAEELKRLKTESADQAD